MLTSLLASATLLLAPSVALAQTTEFPPLVVVNVQVSESISADIEIALGDPCADAIQALREEGLRQLQVEAFQEHLVIVATKQGGARGAATLVCAPEEDTAEPEPEPEPE